MMADRMMTGEARSGEHCADHAQRHWTWPAHVAGADSYAAHTDAYSSRPGCRRSAAGWQLDYAACTKSSVGVGALPHTIITGTHPASMSPCRCLFLQHPGQAPVGVCSPTRANTSYPHPSILGIPLKVCSPTASRHLLSPTPWACSERHAAPPHLRAPHLQHPGQALNGMQPHHISKRLTSSTLGRLSMACSPTTPPNASPPAPWAGSQWHAAPPRLMP